MSCQCPQFLLDQLAIKQTMVEGYATAINAILGAGGIKTYRLDTGQDIQMVERQDIEWMQKGYDSALAQWSVLNNRCGGGGTINMRVAQ